jgi:hypothetical protein
MKLETTLKNLSFQALHGTLGKKNQVMNAKRAFASAGTNFPDKASHLLDFPYRHLGIVAASLDDNSELASLG